MVEADFDRPIVPHVPISNRGKPLWLKGMACVAILPLLGFIGQRGHRLWGEFRSLQDEQVSVRASEIVGYIDINPSPSFARSPDDWLHDEGKHTLLWAGWENGKHHWFTVGVGEIDRRKISTPMGLDVIRAIDFPLFETDGGKRWERVPDEARIAGFDSSIGAIAYPLTVLDKVEMVNDVIADRPVLVAYTPISHKISAFEAQVESHRLTFGHSGYFFQNHPILYDRGTKSLWTEQDNALVAVAGHYRGSSLKRLAELEFVDWSTWKAEHPDGKLLVGADRSKPRPVD